MDHAALKAELTTDPAALGYAAPLDVGNHVAAAALLNGAAETYRRQVPLEELSAYTGPNGITGAVRALIEIPLGSQIAAGPPPAVMDVPTKAALYTVEILLLTDYRMQTADVDDPRFGGACDALVSLGVMTADQKAAVLALGDATRSRAERLFGRAVTAADVGTALSWGN